MRKIKDLANVTITFTDGSTASFADVLAGNAGTEEILDSYYRDLLEVSLNANEDEDLEIERIILPIVSEVVNYAFYNSPEIFREIIKFIIIKCSDLEKAPREEEIVINNETPDQLALFEYLLHRLNNNWKIKEYKASNQQELRIVIKK